MFQNRHSHPKRLLGAGFLPDGTTAQARRSGFWPRAVMVSLGICVVLQGAARGFAQEAQQGQPQMVAPVPTETPKEPRGVAQEVLDAEAAIAKSDWKGAEAKLDPWLAAHPEDARALFAAGYVAECQEKLEEAEKLYGRATDADPKMFQAHVSLGLLLAREKQFDDAHDELEEATKLDAGDDGAELKARAWRALARIDEEDDPAQASTELLEALRLTPETEQDTLLAAELADRADEPDAAERAYRKVLASHPKSVEANAGLAHLSIARRDFAGAETLLRAALEQSPDDPVLSAQLASVLAAQNKGEALPLLEKLHEAHPEDRAIARMLAEVRSEAGDAAGSEQLYLALLKVRPEDVTLLVGHGQNLVHLLKYGEAEAVFEKATKLDPTDGEAWSGLAYASSKLDEPKVTLEALAMRSKYLPEGPESYYLWATAYDRLQDKVEAISYYHHFLEASAGKFQTQEWRAKQRLELLEGKK